MPSQTRLLARRHVGGRHVLRSYASCCGMSAHRNTGPLRSHLWRPSAPAHMAAMRPQTSRTLQRRSLADPVQTRPPPGRARAAQGPSHTGRLDGRGEASLLDGLRHARAVTAAGPGTASMQRRRSLLCFARWLLGVGRVARAPARTRDPRTDKTAWMGSCLSPAALVQRAPCDCSNALQLCTQGGLRADSHVPAAGAACELSGGKLLP